MNLKNNQKNQIIILIWQKLLIKINQSDNLVENLWKVLLREKAAIIKITLLNLIII